MRTVATLILSCTFALPADAHPGNASASIPTDALIQPEELARTVQPEKSTKPLILQVGSNVLFAQAHIPGSEYAGAAAPERGRQRRNTRGKYLRRNKLLDAYC